MKTHFVREAVRATPERDRRVSRFCAVRSLGVVALALSASTSSAQDLRAPLFERPRQVASATLNAASLSAVRDVARLDQERLAVLDNQNMRVVVLDRGLRVIGQIGKKGAGPSEFRQPVRLVSLGAGRVGVLDRALRRFSIFEWKGGRIRFAGQRILKLPVESICALSGGTLIAFALVTNQRLHVLAADGSIIRSFAPDQRDMSLRGKENTTSGTLICQGRARERIAIIVNKLGNDITAYKVANGTLAWADTLKPIRSLSIVEDRNGIALSSGRNGWAQIRSMVSVGTHRIYWAQYVERIDGAGADTVLAYAVPITTAVRAARWVADGIVREIDERSLLVVHEEPDAVRLELVTRNGPWLR